MARSTDVPASLAGYFYQLLLAAVELMTLLNTETVQDSDGVGIEQGSDIRIFTGNGVCIEAKFYKNKSFKRNHATIKHTICNFYNHFNCCDPTEVPDSYVYKTNVPLAQGDKEFFSSWPLSPDMHKNEYKQYILDCIVEESIVKEEQYKKNFKRFKEETEDCPKDDEYKERLFEKLHADHSLYTQYCNMVDERKLEDFISRIRFSFADKFQTKIDTVRTLKNEFGRLLKAYKQDSSLDYNTCVNILFNVVDSLFLTTVQPGVKCVGVAKLKELIEDHENYQSEYYESERYKDAIAAIEEEIDALVDFLEHEYHGDRKSDILHSFVDVVEVLCEAIDARGQKVEEFIQNYCLTKAGLSIKQVTALLRSMSILSVYGNGDIPELITSGSRLGWLQFASEEKPYIIKDAKDFLSNRSILTAFVNQTLNNPSDLDAGIKVVFGTNHMPCKLSKQDIQDLLVFDVAQVSEQDEYLTIYSSLDYKCTYCLRPDPEDGCMFTNVRSFMKGACR